MALSIRQKAKNYTIYPEIPLNVILPNAVAANSFLAVLVFAHRTPDSFNVLYLDAETIAPNVFDDKTDTFTLQDKVVNLSQESGTFSPPLSPPIVSPDVSGYFPSVYVFTAPATVGAQKVTIVDPGNSNAGSPPFAPPIEYGRPVFDGGIEAVVYEIAKPTSISVDKHAHATSNETPLVAALTPTGINEFLLEAAILMDSTALVPASTATLLDSGSFPAGSSSWVVQGTVQTAAVAASGFGNPVKYVGGIVAVALA